LDYVRANRQRYGEVAFSFSKINLFFNRFFRFCLVFFSWANGMKKVSNEGIMRTTQRDVTAGVWTEASEFLEKNNKDANINNFPTFEASPGLAGGRLRRDVLGCQEVGLEIFREEPLLGVL